MSLHCEPAAVALYLAAMLSVQGSNVARHGHAAECVAIYHPCTTSIT
jgi:hypothetical protein